MKIAVISDIHLDHYTDGTKRFCELVDSWDGSKDADVCVVAGDIADGRFPDQYAKLFRKLRARYTRVIAVTGNHDYYKSTLERTHRSIEVAIAQMDGDYDGRSGVHFLDKSSVKVAGRTFHGGTMWYRDDPLNSSYEHWMNDVHCIQGFKRWVYEEQGLFEHYLRGKLGEGDVVVTHHLPSHRCVAPKYRSSALNRFFVCEMDDLIRERRPALWICGHTHEPVDLAFGDEDPKTRLVCNPRGYPRERLLEEAYSPVVVEI